MRLAHPAWIPVCWMLSLANIVSVWFAARPAEPWHATAHAVLSVAFALGARHLRERSRRSGPVPSLPPGTRSPPN